MVEETLSSEEIPKKKELEPAENRSNLFSADNRMTAARYNSRNYDEGVWSGFRWLRVRSNGVFFWGGCLV
jgi:hypothetical protein